MGVAPTEPGMPDSASRPTHPYSTACPTNGSQDSPAATATRTPPQVRSSPSWSARMPVVATSTTVPSNPSSATTTLLPPASTRTGSPASSHRRTASTSSSAVVARTHDRAGPPRRRVVWSRRSSRTHDRHRVAEHALAGTGDAERDGAVVAPGPGDLDLGAVLRHDDRSGELRAELDDPARLAQLLVDVPRGEREREHAVRDDVRKSHTAGDLGVLVDRVGVAARLGVGDQGRTRDRVPRHAEVGHQPPALWA